MGKFVIGDILLKINHRIGQIEAECKVSDTKIKISCLASETYFHVKEFALGLILKVTVLETQGNKALLQCLIKLITRVISWNII